MGSGSPLPDPDYCLLTAKYCIFCASLRGDVLDFQSFLLSVDGKLEILKEIATAKKARTPEILSHMYFNYLFFCCCMINT